MSFLYRFAVLGAPTDAQVEDVENRISDAVEKFGLRFGREVEWLVRPDAFEPTQTAASAAAYFGGEHAPEANLEELLRKTVPVLPVVSDLTRVQVEVPSPLRRFNCLNYSSAGAARVSTALLECVGLLPRQRRLFLSYRRDEARQPALQLFDAFSARNFDVFLDTHSVPVADDFQSVLWHRLCDSDVLVMLDTENYFESRWTVAEFGRALSKGIPVLSIGWPGCTPSPRTDTTSRMDLVGGDIERPTGRLTDAVVGRICRELESVRGHGHAVRKLNLVAQLQLAIERIGGAVTGVGAKNAVYVSLPGEEQVVFFPTLGVPTSANLHEAAEGAPNRSAAVVYDHIGLQPSWLQHLDWLGNQIQSARWVKVTEAAWESAHWEVRS